MILVDTSVWSDHLRIGDPRLTALLQKSQVLAHPWVIGELALGQLSGRSEILGLLGNLPQAKTATEAEVMTLVGTQRLFGLGIGYVDAHLLAATLLTTDASLWTRDKRLAAAAADLGISYRTAQENADGSLLLQPASVVTDAQLEYDGDPELRALLARAAKSSTVHRSRQRRQA